MWSAIVMSGKLYAMESVESLDELTYDSEEFERCEEHINQGSPVVFVDEFETFEDSFPDMEIVVIKRDEEDNDDDE